MYRRYKILQFPEDGFSQEDIKKGNELYEDYSKPIINALDAYLINDNTIDAGKMMKDWFPDIKADAFLSHSHKNIVEVKAFAGWLYNKFGITSFIDSLVWGFVDNLLKDVDNKYCLRKDKKGLYSYKKRNISTSNVHMMLMSSLAKIIDKTECLMFIYTPEAIHLSTEINKDLEKTYSPWIHEELMMSKIIRITPTERNHRVKLYENEIEKSFSIQEDFKFEYTEDTKHLIPLDAIDLNKWIKLSKNNPENNPLDVLYYAFS